MTDLSARALRVAMYGFVPADDPHVIADMQAQIKSNAKVIAALREALEGYACYGLEKCPVPKLKDGSCIHAGTGHCGDTAFRAIEQTAGNEP